MTALMDLREESKARFDIDGFVNYGRVISDDELGRLQTRIDDICDGRVQVPEKCLRMQPDWEAHGYNRRDAVWQVLGAHEYDDVIQEICAKQEIIDVISLLIEGDVRLWSTQFLMKPAHHGAVVPWHQDSSYWGEEKRMTCWLAIDDATPFNGCMRMIPGSHRRGQLQFTEKKFEEVGIALKETDAICEDTQLYVPVRAGCASFHHPLTLHASDANTTPHRRRAVAITYARIDS